MKIVTAFYLYEGAFDKHSGQIEYAEYTTDYIQAYADALSDEANIRLTDEVAKLILSCAIAWRDEEDQNQNTFYYSVRDKLQDIVIGYSYNDNLSFSDSLDQDLEYDPDLKIATFSGIYYNTNEDCFEICINEEAHNVESEAAARAIWGLDEDLCPNL